MAVGTDLVTYPFRSARFVPTLSIRRDDSYDGVRARYSVGAD